MRDTDNLGPEGAGETSEGVWPYLGVGCLTAVSGAMAFGMIAVLVAKLVGWASNCAPEAETGAPCNWLTFWVRGAILGFVVVPAVVIWRIRKARATRKTE